MSSDNDRNDHYETAMAISTRESISIFGGDLSRDFIGEVSFGAYAFRLIMLREPSPGEQRLFEAVLVALADHGFTPTAIAARMTYLSAPDAIQGAIAAGILGGGSRFLGVSEDTGRILSETLAGLVELPSNANGWDQVAVQMVSNLKERKSAIPGLGHHLHKDGDPRVPKLFEVAREAGTFGPHLSLFEAMGRVAPQVLGKNLPLNGAGCCGAALAELGIPQPLLRGVVLLARCAGLLGHIADEIRTPVAQSIFAHVENHAVSTSNSTDL
ncbi:MAG: citryl-CoA lyase [Actinomycetota bacterium]|nr:citryl-CoA lyase [Actinomycetota bacterium]